MIEIVVSLILLTSGLEAARDFLERALQVVVEVPSASLFAEQRASATSTDASL